jgi:CTP:molybdopterin cytidylyltransferase MocA
MGVAAIVIATDPASWRPEPLALIPWGEDATLGEFHVEQLRAAGVRDIEVVLGYQADAVIPFVAGDNVEPIVNAAWEAEPSSTLRTGAAALVRGTTAAIVIDIAEPRPASLLRALRNAHEDSGAEVTVPSCEGAPGTPIVLGAEAIAMLRNVRGDADLASVVDRFSTSTRHLAFDTDVIFLRIDSAGSYERAMASLTAR